MHGRRTFSPTRWARLLGLCTLLSVGTWPFWSTAQTTDSRKVVIPFDFESQFDNGRYGQMVGDMIWKKLSQEGGFLLPEAMADVRDFCDSRKIHLGPSTPVETVKKIIREDFDAHIGIWGSVERVPGHEWDVYDLVIKCVDFSGPDPKVIYEVSTRTQTVSEIPHKYVKEMIDKLYDRQPGAPPPVNAIAEKNWKENPNLVIGDFEQGVGHPKGWDSRGGQQREPLGRLVKWIPEPGNPSNKIIRLEFPASIGDAEGVMYYSDYFPVEAGATYRFQCRWRTSGVNGKVFIKCGEPIGSEYRATSAGRPLPPGSKVYRPDESQIREVYRSQINLKGPTNTWNVHVEEFTPRHTKYTPRYGRIMLYGYLGAGWIDFDDIVLKQIIPPSPGEQNKELRHSLETKVTLKEMEENERKSREAEEQEEAKSPRTKTKPGAKTPKSSYRK